MTLILTLNLEHFTTVLEVKMYRGCNANAKSGFIDPVNLNFHQFCDISCSECLSIVSVELVRLPLDQNLSSIC